MAGTEESPNQESWDVLEREHLKEAVRGNEFADDGVNSNEAIDNKEKIIT